MKSKPIEHPDTSCEDYDYWNEVLNSYGLSIRRGEFPTRLVNPGTDTEHKESVGVFVGSSRDLVGVEEEQQRKKFFKGRVEPKGHGPDRSE